MGLQSGPDLQEENSLLQKLPFLALPGLTWASQLHHRLCQTASPNSTTPRSGLHWKASRLKPPSAIFSRWKAGRALKTQAPGPRLTQVSAAPSILHTAPQKPPYGREHGGRKSLNKPPYSGAAAAAGSGGEREKRGEDGLHTARGNNKLHPSAAAALDLLNNLFYLTFIERNGVKIRFAHSAVRAEAVQKKMVCWLNFSYEGGLKMSDRNFSKINK